MRQQDFEALFDTQSFECNDDALLGNFPNDKLEMVQEILEEMKRTLQEDEPMLLVVRRVTYDIFGKVLPQMFGIENLGMPGNSDVAEFWQRYNQKLGK